MIICTLTYLGEPIDAFDDTVSVDSEGGGGERPDHVPGVLYETGPVAGVPRLESSCAPNPLGCGRRGTPPWCVCRP